DPDTGHGAPTERPSSLERIATHLANDEAAPLLHTVDPWLADSAPLAVTASLADLAAATETATAALRAGPADVSRPLADAERRHDSLLARRRVTEDRLAAATANPTCSRAGRSHPVVERHPRTLAAIDRELAAASRRITDLRAQDAAHRSFI